MCLVSCLFGRIRCVLFDEIPLLFAELMDTERGDYLSHHTLLRPLHWGFDPYNNAIILIYLQYAILCPPVKNARVSSPPGDGTSRSIICPILTRRSLAPPGEPHETSTGP